MCDEMSEPTFARIMQGLMEANAMAKGDLSQGHIYEVVDGKPTDVTPQRMKETLDLLSQGGTGGTWSWERESDGRATIYAGRTPERHGLNLFGRIEPDSNGLTNLNFVVALVNAYRSGRLVVKDTTE